jgi:eukaryotic-like serine/threonine-protein kinase
VVVALAVLAANRTHRGIGIRELGPEESTPVRLHRGAAHDYDPHGTSGEHPEKTQFAIDTDPTTYWNTEDYRGGSLQKPGVGLYLDAEPRVAATALRIRTRTPGWTGEVYGAASGPPESVEDPGWVRIGSIASAPRDRTLDISDGSRSFRYYLIWITKLPPGGSKVEISELALFG